jgi:hypothetical protein
MSEPSAPLPAGWNWPELEELMNTWTEAFCNHEGTKDTEGYTEFIARCAANWQLRQVIQLLESNWYNFTEVYDFDKSRQVICKALRPAPAEPVEGQQRLAQEASPTQEP